MTILGSTKLGKTITGHAELVSLAVEQAELGAEIDPVTLEDETIERFIQCATHALPYFSVRPSKKSLRKPRCSRKFLPLSDTNRINALCQVHLWQTPSHQHVECYFSCWRSISGSPEDTQSIRRNVLTLWHPGQWSTAHWSHFYGTDGIPSTTTNGWHRCPQHQSVIPVLTRGVPPLCPSHARQAWPGISNIPQWSGKAERLQGEAAISGTWHSRVSYTPTVWDSEERE